ncbi:DUF7352 domain-containing protein [Anaeromusa acidaminophila]|uniref:DUF7352 domain-containing protein n=1 Tax=Anaeromusa acidaminophila TaxID=81464 RepID=UPI000376697D|nr:hypothetical protein [Anaeromusa acidaminophila]
MRKIFKYALETTDLQVIRIPKLNGASSFKDQYLNIAVQKGIPCVWCLVDDEQESQEVAIRIVGTGNPMPDLSKEEYLGSYMVSDGDMVFHVFIEK